MEEYEMAMKRMVNKKIRQMADNVRTVPTIHLSFSFVKVVFVLRKPSIMYWDLPHMTAYVCGVPQWYECY